MRWALSYSLYQKVLPQGGRYCAPCERKLTQVCVINILPWVPFRLLTSFRDGKLLVYYTNVNIHNLMYTICQMGNKRSWIHTNGTQLAQDNYLGLWGNAQNSLKLRKQWSKTLILACVLFPKLCSNTYPEILWWQAFHWSFFKLLQNNFWLHSFLWFSMIYIKKVKVTATCFFKLNFLLLLF